MYGTEFVQLNTYSPAGNLIVLVICSVLVFLMFMTYLPKSTNLRIFQGMLAALITAAVADIMYHISLDFVESVPHIVIYLLRFICHLSLFVNLYLYILYLMKPLHLEKKQNVIYIVVSSVILGLAVGYELIQAVFPFGFRIMPDGEIYEGLNVFIFAYAFFMVIVLLLLLRFRIRLVKQIFYSVFGTCIFSMIVLALQGIYKTSSFTTITFVFPLIMLMYLIHSNPYDIDIGAVGPNSFRDSLKYSYKKKRDLMMMSLYLPEFDENQKEFPKEFKEIIRKFSAEYFQTGTVLFQISDGRMVLTIDMASNPAYENGINRMLNDFSTQYEIFNMDFKIVITKTYEKLSEINDYVGFIEYIENRMHLNDVHFVEDADIEAYFNYCYILSQLNDIHEKQDMDDPRVQVYCQPVFNVATGKYDTAEALMRLSLDKIPMVYPDIFIPLAEQSRCIHTLSLIILSKTCHQIKKMMQAGIGVNRISVNFSVIEVRDPNFCSDIERIIKDVGIPSEKIAIEITESQNESDFIIMKDKINELRKQGIKFYLDDFGTGYSNFERIMELPFDIIKFDRSLVISCGSDEKSEKMVSYLAKMFDSMDYSVLYEGVETDRDEQKCVGMYAKYLQGYKYSKPIPIERLDEYFEHTA